MLPRKPCNRCYPHRPDDACHLMDRELPVGSTGKSAAGHITRKFKNILEGRLCRKAIRASEMFAEQPVGAPSTVQKLRIIEESFESGGAVRR